MNINIYKHTYMATKHNKYDGTKCPWQDMSATLCHMTPYPSDTLLIWNIFAKNNMDAHKCRQYPRDMRMMLLFF